MRAVPTFGSPVEVAGPVAAPRQLVVPPSAVGRVAAAQP